MGRGYPPPRSEVTKAVAVLFLHNVERLSICGEFIITPYLMTLKPCGSGIIKTTQKQRCSQKFSGINIQIFSFQVSMEMWVSHSRKLSAICFPPRVWSGLTPRYFTFSLAATSFFPHVIFTVDCLRISCLNQKENFRSWLTKYIAYCQLAIHLGKLAHSKCFLYDRNKLTWDQKCWIIRIKE